MKLKGRKGDFRWQTEMVNLRSPDSNPSQEISAGISSRRRRYGK